MPGTATVPWGKPGACSVRAALALSDGRLTATQGSIVRPPMQPGFLVVDNEPAIRKLMRTVLDRHGFAVWLAADGREALTIFQQHRQIALVLLDVRIRAGMARRPW